MLRSAARAAVLALLLSACPAQTPVIQPTPTAEPSPTETVTAKPKRKDPKAKLAVYSTGSSILLYDVKKDSLSTAASGQGLEQPKFLTKGVITFVQRSSQTSRASLVRLDLRSGAQERLFEDADGIYAYELNPARDTVCYVSVDRHGFPHIRFRSLVGERSLYTAGSLARALGRGSTPSDQLAVEWSSDGSFVLVVFTPADGDAGRDVAEDQSQFQIRRASGSSSYAADPGDEPTMGAWTPDGKRVYFRTTRGARVWIARTGAVESVNGGATWFNPWIAPDGRSLAYDTGEDSARVQVKVLDLRSGATRTIEPSGRFHPVFERTGVVWVQEVVRCRNCLGGTRRTANVYRVNLANGNTKEIALGSLAGIDVFYA
ncbi:MAG TPA: hypothetical protein VGB83_06870 [Actinomycetota bacterium]